jgi:hypothetical protein
MSELEFDDILEPVIEYDTAKVDTGVYTQSSLIDGKIVMNRFSDLEPTLDLLSGMRQITDGKGKEFWWIGDIPNVIVEKYLNENGVTYQDFLQDTTHARRILQDPDYKKFRVFEGAY